MGLLKESLFTISKLANKRIFIPVMIHTSRNKLRTFIRTQYASMLAEANELSKQELSELGRLLKRRLPPPPPGAEIEEIPPEDVEMIPPEGDFGSELDGAEWMSQYPGEFDVGEPGAGDTQTMMRSIDIEPGQKRPLAKRFGLAESELRDFILSVIKGK